MSPPDHDDLRFPSRGGTSSGQDSGGDLPSLESGSLGDEPLESALDGDEQDHLRLDEVLEHRTWMRGLALQLARDPDLAGDLEQDTWLKLLGKPPRRDVNLKPWITTVMMNTARNGYRGRQRRSVREHEWSRTRDTTERPGLDREVVEDLLTALGRLDERYRDVLVLRFYGQFSPKEIGAQKAIPAATVRTQLRRALQQMRDELDRRYGEDHSLWGAGLAVWAVRGTDLPAGLATDVATQVPATGVGPVASVSPVVGLTGLGLWWPLAAVLLTGCALFWVPAWLNAESGRERSEGVPHTALSEGAAAVPDGQGGDLDREGAATWLPDARRELVGSLVVPAPDKTPSAASLETAPVPMLRVHAVDAESGAPIAGAVLLPAPPTDRYALTSEQVSDRTRFTGAPILIPEGQLEPFALSELSSLVDVHIGAPGYEWSFARFRVDDVGDRTEELKAGAELAVELTVPAEANGLQLRVKNMAGNMLRVSEVVGGDTPLRVSWPGLPAAALDLELVCVHRPPTVLDRWSTRLSPGDVRELTLHSAAGEAGIPRLELYGTLILPVGEMANPEIRVEAFGELPRHLSRRKGSALRHMAVLTEPEALPDGRRLYRWTVGEQPVGEYGVAVKPFSLVNHVHLAPERPQGFEIVVPPREALRVSLVEATTGASVEGDRLAWFPAAQFTFDRRLGTTKVRRDVAAEFFEIAVTPGAFVFVAQREHTSTQRGYYGWVELEIEPGQRELLVPVQKVSRVDVTVSDQGELRPFEVRSGHLLEIERVDGVDFWLRDSLDRSSSFDVAMPGLYELSFGDLDGYAPVVPLLVEIQEGVDQQLVIELLRNN